MRLCYVYDYVGSLSASHRQSGNYVATKRGNNITYSTVLMIKERRGVTLFGVSLRKILKDKDRGRDLELGVVVVGW